jgi:hypothetical protein
MSLQICENPKRSQKFYEKCQIFFKITFLGGVHGGGNTLSPLSCPLLNSCTVRVKGTFNLKDWSS